MAFALSGGLTKHWGNYRRREASLKFRSSGYGLGKLQHPAGHEIWSAYRLRDPCRAVGGSRIRNGKVVRYRRGRDVHDRIVNRQCDNWGSYFVVVMASAVLDMNQALKWTTSNVTTVFVKS